MLAVLICGSRGWTDIRVIHSWLESVKPDRVIHGGARGADALAEASCRRLGIATWVRIPDWDRYGRKRAGFIRNEEMLDELQGLADSGWDTLVTAFWDGISSGTKQCFTSARNRGFQVVIVENKGGVG